MEIAVVIPSKGRANTILTHKYVANAKVCVAESEVGEYREVNPNIEYVVHPDSIVGLVQKREFIRKKFENVFMIDDDIKGFLRMTQKQGETSKVSPELAYDVIQNAGNMAKLCGAYLFSFNLLKRPEHYAGHIPLRMSGCIAGCAFGILKGSDKLIIDPRIKMCYEYFISGLNAFHYRKAFFDDRFSINQDGYGNAPGGAAAIRTRDVEQQDMNILKAYFGEAIVQQTDITKGKKEFDKRLNIPF